MSTFTPAEIVDAPARETHQAKVGDVYFLEVLDPTVQKRVITLHPDLLSTLLQLRTHGRFRRRPGTVGVPEREEMIFEAIIGKKIGLVAKIPVDKIEPRIALATSLPTKLVTP